MAPARHQKALIPSEYLRTLYQQTTPGPWHLAIFLTPDKLGHDALLGTDRDGAICEFFEDSKGDREFIVALRTLLPALADVAGTLETYFAFEGDIRRFAQSPEQVADECKSAYRAVKDAYDRLAAAVVAVERTK